ncbi:MAG: AraC family transcriptional regulator [Marinomonas foliarum]|jgi:AraC-like DNA-binding protein|uniref:AraC family transcriptional regulator n=1 Tax=Marinomonas foliarum TaxID=491950 RepID=A0A369AH38_9GAMM|nr:AraC family transcriptional regulator [Marinomonas foliarum]QRV22370.1 AraC family transcriptional regulator [Marinomonas foliarum]RCX08453.1 AraC family transcriptional regulator [Marinomonas foliarum]
MKFDFSIYDLHVAEASSQTLTNILRDKAFGEYYFIQSSPLQKLAKLTFKEFGPLSILEYEAGTSTNIRASKVSSAYFLHIILSGHSIGKSNNEVRTLRAGDSILIMPGTRFESNNSKSCRKLIVKIPTDFLHQTARKFGYVTTKDPIQFEHKANVFPMTGPLFNLLNDMLQQDKRTLCDRALIYYCRLFNSAILTMFKSNFTQPQSTLSLHRHVERVRNYVLDNITADITIDELAKVCQISRKSLYNLFEREAGLTPSAYIRRLKLESIHSELKNNERIRNVTQVALEYGFTNLGRFSAQYREQIGELPSQTLRHFTH